MKKHLLILSLLLPLFAFAQTNCITLPNSFKSYEIAVRDVEEAKFSFIDKANTSKSSWITTAKYYSCDGKTGYLIISLKNRTYIHQDLPMQIWRKFKAASSFGSFYNENIKHRYRLKLKH